MTTLTTIFVITSIALLLAVELRGMLTPGANRNALAFAILAATLLLIQRISILPGLLRPASLDISQGPLIEGGILIITVAMLAIVIIISRMLARYREQSMLASALVNCAALLNSTLDLHQVLNHVLASLREVVPHDRASILLNEGDMVNVARISHRQGDYGTPTGNSGSPQPGH